MGAADINVSTTLPHTFRRSRNKRGGHRIKGFQHMPPIVLITKYWCMAVQADFELR